MSPTKAAKRYASLTEAAQYVGCGPRTIRRYVAAGKLPRYQLGPRLIRVDLNELDALLRSGSGH